MFVRKCFPFRFKTNLPLHQNRYRGKNFYLNLMVDNGSSGKQTIDDKERYEKIKQRLNEIDETLQNLTQMLATLTVEGKRKPNGGTTRPTWRLAKGGYDDWHRPQIGLKIDNGDSFRTSPTGNHNFSEPFPLRVYERQNQGALRWHDDDNEFEDGGSFPRVAAKVFSEQDEFFPPFRDGDDSRLPQQRNIQQR